MINKKRADVLLKTSARFIVRPMRIKDMKAHENTIQEDFVILHFSVLFKGKSSFPLFSKKLH
jgi:hypothetical protein